MIKRVIALILCAVITTAAAVPAMAAEDSLNEQLEQVTLIVKETLDIDDRYTSFSGDLTEDGDFSYWTLYWSCEDASLRVRADSDGKILYYYLSSSSSNYDYDYNSFYSPVFAENDIEEAYASALAFVENLLDENESADFNEYETQPETDEVSSYSFSGTVMLNGLKSPITFSVRVNASDMHIERFYRSDRYTYYSGDIPLPEASVSEDTAAELLAGTVELQLQYVLDDEDGQTAVLRYLPVDSGEFIVEADTGELVNVDEVYYDTTYAGGGMGGVATADSEAAEEERGLSEVEQSTIEILEDILSKEELDSAVRSMSELGIMDDYTLDSAEYSMDTDTGDVSCSLYYVQPLEDEDEIGERYTEYLSELQLLDEIYPIYTYKYLTVDATTCELLSLYTYSSVGYEETVELDSSEMSELADAFLEKYFSETYSACALNENSSTTDEGYFAYCQIENSILFPTNSASISVNTYDGYIESFSLNWTEDITFASPEDIISYEDAESAYIGCYDTVLQYAQVPSELDSDGYSYNYQLKLAYKLDSDETITGIDANTGEAITPYADETDETLAYDDIEGCYGQNQIETLAKYEIGFSGSEFKPTAELTQKDALILLIGALSYSKEDEEILYEWAYSYGFLNSDEKDPDKLMTRAELIKMLIGATEWGAAGELQGIFDCGFSDDSSISDEYFGYIAIAKGLGVIQGDSENNFRPDDTVSRQDAAIMLYNFMSR